MSFIIDPSSISFTAISADLDSFIASSPDNARWKDFFQSSTGTIVKQLVAGFSTYLQHNITVARRESFSRYAKNRSSLVASAETVGYSVFRGKNAVLKLTILPSSSGLWPKWKVIGSIKDQNLILAEDATVNAGVSITVSVILGVVNTETLRSPSASPNSFRYKSPDVSSDVRVFVDGIEANQSEKILDLINEKFVVQSNVFGAVDVMYLNSTSFSTRYNTASTIEIRYISLNNPTFSLTAIKFDFGTLLASEITSAYQEIEDSEAIRINAPLYNETQFVIRGREDYRKIFKLLDTSIVSTSGEDINPAVVNLYYVKNTLALYNSTEKSAFIDKLSLYRPFGIHPPEISDPTIVFLDLAVEVDQKGVGNSSVDIAPIVDQLEKKLGMAISLANLENAIEALSYVRIARVQYIPEVYTLNNYYLRGNRITPTSVITCDTKQHEFVRKIYKSGVTEPSWNTELKDQTEDVYYSGVHAWAEQSGVRFLAEVIGTQGNCIRLSFDGVKTLQTVVTEWNSKNLGNQVRFTPSGSSALVFPAQKLDLLKGLDTFGVNGDGSGMIWETMQLNTCAPPLVWSSRKEYQIGDVTKASNTAHPFDAIQFKAIGFINKSARNVLAIPATAGVGNGANACILTTLEAGEAGNNISVTFDGVKTLDFVINAWNVANPNNVAKIVPPSAGTSVPSAGSITLSGGAGVNASGTYFGVDITAASSGSGGNLINLTFNGSKTFGSILDDWNTANPKNQIKVPSVPTILTTVYAAGRVDLLNGIDAANREPNWPSTIGGVC